MRKADGQTIHAIWRGLERFGVGLEAVQLQQLVRSIQRGEARFVRRESLRRTLWEVEVGGQPAVAVYDRERKTICTLMRPEESHSRLVTLAEVEARG